MLTIILIWPVITRCQDCWHYEEMDEHTKTNIQSLLRDKRWYISFITCRRKEFVIQTIVVDWREVEVPIYESYMIILCILMLHYLLIKIRRKYWNNIFFISWVELCRCCKEWSKDVNGCVVLYDVNVLWPMMMNIRCI